MGRAMIHVAHQCQEYCYSSRMRCRVHCRLYVNRPSGIFERLKSQITGPKPLSHHRKEETGKSNLWAVWIYKKSPGHVCGLEVLQSGRHWVFFKVKSNTKCSRINHNFFSFVFCFASINLCMPWNIWLVVNFTLHWFGYYYICCSFIHICLKHAKL